MASTSPLTTLSEEFALITSLVDLMQQEQQFLVAADSDGLHALTPRKAQLITQLSQLAAQRHQHLGAGGFKAAEAGMEAWLDSCNDGSASALWQALLGKTRDAKELNRVNGMLISKHMSHNQNLINAMRAPAGGADTSFYGPSGQTTPSGPSRRYVVG